MGRFAKFKNISIISIFLAICAVAAVATSGSGWWSIVPPLLAVTLALLTGHLYFSLIAAVMVGGILSSVVPEPGSLSSWGQGLGNSARYVLSSALDPINLQIMIFVVLVMAMISVVLVSGGLQALIQWLGRYAKGPRSTSILTAILGVLIFIDDYTNTMIVGTSMRPLADKHKVSREKLSFLVDATSAPVSGVAVISTWIGYEVGLFAKAAESLGIPKDGYSIFFDALPFRFYCFLMIAFVFLNVFLDQDFGPMARAEQRARQTGAVSEPGANPMSSKTFANLEPHAHAKQRALGAIVPFVVMFAVLFGGLWWDGGGFARIEGSPLAIFHPVVWRDVISAAENNILILAYASGAGLVAAILCGFLIARLKIHWLAKATWAGIKSSILPLGILLLAWALKSACDQLGTGVFLTSAVGGVLSPAWFPVLVYLVAGATAFATGTSWGTMAILIPTASPLAFQLDGGTYGITTILSFAAVLDGAIFGDHCSPISDTTIMSSISSSCDHMDHVKTQLPYALTVAVIAAVFGYIPAALGLSSLISLGLGILAIALIFLVQKKRRRGELISRGAQAVP